MMLFIVIPILFGILCVYGGVKAASSAKGSGCVAAILVTIGLLFVVVGLVFGSCAASPSHF